MPDSATREHLLGIEGLSPATATAILDRAQAYAEGEVDRLKERLRGRTQINLFFENSTRTQASFELAGKRLGADVMNMSVRTSSISKGETLLDTAATLNAMRPDVIVIRHEQSGAPALLAAKVDAAVINAGDGTHEHPTQALLDALTIRRRKGRVHRLTVAICGDVAHSRVARSKHDPAGMLENRVRVCAPPRSSPPRSPTTASRSSTTWPRLCRAPTW